MTVLQICITTLQSRFSIQSDSKRASEPRGARLCCIIFLLSANNVIVDTFNGYNYFAINFTLNSIFSYILLSYQLRQEYSMLSAKHLRFFDDYCEIFCTLILFFENHFTFVLTCAIIVSTKGRYDYDKNR